MKKRTINNKGESEEGLFSGENGMALVITLIVVAILTVVVLEFSYKMRVDLSIAGNFRDETKAYYLAKSGIHTVIAVLREDDENKYDGQDDDWALLNNKTVPIGEGTVKLMVVDESSKLNINYLVENNDINSGVFNILKAEEIFRRLMELQGIPEEDIDTIIDSTMDWLDKNDDSRTEGAEEHYYQTLYTPYIIRNGLLNTISELRMIKGYDDNILLKLGAYKDIYGNVDPGYLSYLTIHSDGKININTASSKIIESLSDEITIDDADDIIKRREEEPFENIGDVNNIITANDKWNSIKDKIDIKSNYYSIVSEAYIILNRNTEPQTTLKKRITAIVKRDNKDENHIKILYWRTE